VSTPTIKAGIRRGFLDEIGETGLVAALTLLESLRQFKSGVFSESFKSGRVYLSTSGSGQAASFISVPGFLLGSQGEVFNMAQEFVELYTLVCSDNPTVADDAGAGSRTLLAAMLADNSLAGVSVAANDWTMLGFPWTGPATTS
jgi:hypothetical protein